LEVIDRPAGLLPVHGVPVPEIVKPERLELDAFLLGVFNGGVLDPREGRAGVLDLIAPDGRSAFAISPNPLVLGAPEQPVLALAFRCRVDDRVPVHRFTIDGAELVALADDCKLPALVVDVPALGLHKFVLTGTCGPCSTYK
jgi:hypothetical protein